MLYFIRLAIIVSVVFFNFSYVASAATINVSSDSDTNTGCTLRAAVDSVNSGTLIQGCLNTGGDFGDEDQIDFTVTEVRDLDTAITITQDVMINPNGDRVTINGDGDERIFTIDGATDVTLDNLVLEGGNTTSSGGAINLVSEDEDSSLVINNSVIRNNSADLNGGGISILAGDITLNNTTVSGNTAGEDGGGIEAGRITGTIGTNLSLINSTISKNTAGMNGGGVLADFGMSGINSTISGNLSGDVGGGVYSPFRATLFTNSTITGNSASNSAGGIFVGSPFGNISSLFRLTNTLVSGNTAPEASEVSVSTVNTLFGILSIFIEWENSLIGDSGKTSSQAFLATVTSQGQTTPITEFTINDFSVIATSDGNNPTSLENILAPLADNGGPTMTHALVNTSPAINAGDCTPTSGNSFPEVDQRGEPRIQSTACDIGAFESEFSAPAPIQDETFFVVPLPNNRAVIFPL